MRGLHTAAAQLCWPPPPQTRLHPSVRRGAPARAAAADAAFAEPTRAKLPGPASLFGRAPVEPRLDGVPQRAPEGGLAPLGLAPLGHPTLPGRSYASSRSSRAPPLPRTCRSACACRGRAPPRAQRCQIQPLWCQICPPGRPAEPGRHTGRRQQRADRAASDLAGVSGKGADPARHEVDRATTEPEPPTMRAVEREGRGTVEGREKLVRKKPRRRCH
jgi:hypothetical protein